jgi:hypothetical protein
MSIMPDSNNTYHQTIIRRQFVDGIMYHEYVVQPKELEKYARYLMEWPEVPWSMHKFRKFVSTVCAVADQKNEDVAKSLFERCRNIVFTDELMQQAWNIVAEIIIKCGALPDRREISIYKEFIKIANSTYDWKKLSSEKDKDDSTGPSLMFDVYQSNPLNELSTLLMNCLQTVERESEARGFKGPRCLTDECSILVGSQRNDARCVHLFRDLHVWCVDEKNNILDYPIEDIESEYWSNDVVYRPFDAEHVSLIYKDVIEYAKQSHQYIDKISHMSEEEKLNEIENNTFPKLCCIWRAKALRDRDPTRYSMVIGSLGFKQADGNIFWEYG